LSFCYKRRERGWLLRRRQIKHLARKRKRTVVVPQPVENGRRVVRTSKPCPGRCRRRRRCRCTKEAITGASPFQPIDNHFGNVPVARRFSRLRYTTRSAQDTFAQACRRSRRQEPFVSSLCEQDETHSCPGRSSGGGCGCNSRRRTPHPKSQTSPPNSQLGCRDCLFFGATQSRTSSYS